jgi:hypothetical protein
VNRHVPLKDSDPGYREISFDDYGRPRMAAMATADEPPRKEGTSSSLAIRRIVEAFMSLDSHGNNSLNHSDVQTLFLGLGYQPIDITIAELLQRRCESSSSNATKATNAAYNAAATGSTREDRWTLPQVIDVLRQVRRAYSR